MNPFISLLTNSIELGGEGLRLAAVASAFAGLLAGVVLISSLLLRRWLSPAQKCMLWALVLVRLLMPWAPASAWSLQNLFGPAASTANVATSGFAEAKYPKGEAILDAHLPTSASAIPTQPSLGEGLLRFFDTTLPLVWLVGGLLVLVWTVVVQWRFSRRVNGTPVCQEARLLELWATCCAQVGVRRVIPLVVCDAVQQPALMGLLHTRLLLPADARSLDDDQLSMIMLHELAHVCRYDVGFNWLLVCVRAVHWWNPIYWLAVNRFGNYREQACDAFVLRRLTETSHRGYSELILTLAARPGTSLGWRVALPASILGFLPSYFRKQAVRERLRALPTAATKPGVARTVAAIVTVVVVAVCGLTNATPPVEKNDVDAWFPSIDGEAHTAETVSEADLGPAETRTFDVAKLMVRLHADDPNPASSRAMFERIIANLVESRRSGLRLSAIFQSPSQTTWMDQKPASTYKLVDDRLTVHGPANLLAEVAEYLKAWETGGMGQISVECRFITTDEDIASSLGVSWQYREAVSAAFNESLPVTQPASAPVLRAQASVSEFLPVAVASLSASQARTLVDRGQAIRQVNLLQAPKVTLFNGQTAMIVDITQRPFLVGTTTDRAGSSQPNVRVLEQGIKITLRPIHSADRSHVRLNARLELCSIGEIHTSQTMLKGKPTQIEIPSAKQCRIDIACDVPAGQSVLIGCVPSYMEKRILYTLLTVRNLEESRTDAAVKSN